MNTPDPRALLSAYRDGEAMSPAAREAAWSRLQAALADDLSEGPAGPARRAPTHRARWAAALLAAAAIALVIAGLRGRAGRARSERDSQAMHAAPTRAVDTPAPRSGPAPTREPAPAVTAPPPTAPARPTPARLDAELALLRGARAALAAGTGAEALALLAEHERRFPSGHLAEERVVLTVQALCALGRRVEAQATAARFVARHPDSPHAPTLTAACDDRPAP